MDTRPSFLQSKLEFDQKYCKSEHFKAFLPVDLQFNKEYSIKSSSNKPNEEYYKWQFFYSIVASGLYKKDYIGVEVYFPKGNKDSKPLKLDGAIFDEPNWFEWYKKWRENKNQEALDYLRQHLIGVIEFKKEDSKNIETVYNQQLKAGLHESESNFCLGVIYDTEKLYLFQRKESKYLRLDSSYNLKGEKSTTGDLSLHLADAYVKFPSFEQLIKRTAIVTIDRSKRTVDDLDIITGVFSQQIKDAIFNIVKTMDRLGMKNQIGYSILIEILALKIHDEKRSQRFNSYLKFYKNEPEKKKLDLLFYITENERNFTNLNDSTIQTFILRMKQLYEDASGTYHFILNKSVDWTNQSHVNVISTVVEELQDYSFVRSYKTDLYQLVFYKFASEFSKSDKGQFITPIPLIDFLVKIVNPRNDEKMIDPTVGIADFLSVSYVNSNSNLDDKNIYGLDNDQQMIMLAQLNMLLNGDGNAVLQWKPDLGSIIWKFNSQGDLVELDPELHNNGNWDNWKDGTKLKKFDVVLTNPPFGDARKFEPKTDREKKIIEMYELWHLARYGNSIDLGLVFLENAYRILKEGGRLGIVLSNSIASIDRWANARKWLLEKMRLVATFDLPSSVFADTGVNTTLIIAYKPASEELIKLKERGYEVYIRDIKKVGYEVKTIQRVKHMIPTYKFDQVNFEVEIDEEGNPKLDEEFTDTISEFKKWALTQEEALQKLFL